VNKKIAVGNSKYIRSTVLTKSFYPNPNYSPELPNFAFLSRVSVLTRDIDTAILSVRLSVRPSVRDVPVSDENGLTYRHSFFTVR